MSVEENFYVIYGYEIDYKTYSSLKSKAIDNENWDFVDLMEEWTIIDCYSRDYAYLGKTIVSMNDRTDDGVSSIINIPTNDDGFKPPGLEVREKYIEIMGTEPKEVPKLIAIKHST